MKPWTALRCVALPSPWIRIAWVDVDRHRETSRSAAMSRDRWCHSIIIEIVSLLHFFLVVAVYITGTAYSIAVQSNRSRWGWVSVFHSLMVVHRVPTQLSVHPQLLTVAGHRRKSPSVLAQLLVTWLQAYLWPELARRPAPRRDAVALGQCTGQGRGQIKVRRWRHHRLVFENIEWQHGGDRSRDGRPDASLGGVKHATLRTSGQPAPPRGRLRIASLRRQSRPAWKTSLVSIALDVREEIMAASTIWVLRRTTEQLIRRINSNNTREACADTTRVPLF